MAVRNDKTERRFSGLLARLWNQRDEFANRFQALLAVILVPHQPGPVPFALGSQQLIHPLGFDAAEQEARRENLLADPALAVTARIDEGTTMRATLLTRLHAEAAQ